MRSVVAPGGTPRDDQGPLGPRSAFIDEWVAHHARSTPSAPALLWGESDVITYADLDRRVRAFAAELTAAGVRAADRVLVVLANSAAMVVASLAAQRIAAIPVEVGRDWAADALADIVHRTRPRMVVFGARDAAKWESVGRRSALPEVWTVGAGADVTFASHVGSLHEDGRIRGVAREGSSTPHVRNPDDPALILFTSGSTAKPHGVVQTYRNLDANSRSIRSYLELSGGDRALLTLPLSYCYGRSVLQTHLLVGGSVRLEPSFAFPGRVMEAVARHACTGFAGVPLTFELLRRQVDLSTIDLASLRYVTQAGGPMHPETIAWARAAFAPARLFVMYGQTEATARLAYLPPESADRKPGSVGVPIPGVELRVADARGRPVAVGEVGELLARGDNVTPGYYDEPAASAEILRDGWLWTGDLARMDEDGYVFIVGRAREVMKIGGHRVSPVEIENALNRHPDLAEAGVVGRADQLMGEVPVAFVVVRPGAPFDPDALRQFCLRDLPAYMVPVRFVRVERLPRNASGKLLRHDLRELLGDPSPPTS